MERRTFIKSAAGVCVLAAGGGVWRTHQQGVLRAGSGPAYEPWTDWREADEGPLALVRAGILAANPHNTQPWLFRVNDSSIELHADMSRNLGAFDSYRREMLLGLGCAVENMIHAAAPNGYAAAIKLADGNLAENLPAEPRMHAAKLDLTLTDAVAGPLYRFIPRRHTNRGPYETGRRLPQKTLDAFLEASSEDPDLRVFLFTDEPHRSLFAELVIQATEAIIADERMVADSERWFRHSWSDIQEHRDGPTLDAAGLPPFTTAMAKMMPAPSAETNHRYWFEATRDVQVPESACYGMIAVRDLYDISQTLRAGGLWQRLHLLATSMGISMQPLNQPLELVDRDRELGREPVTAERLENLTGDSGWRPTFGFRAGYPKRPSRPSPRRSVEDVLI